MKKIKNKRFSLIEIMIGTVVTAILFGLGASAASDKIEQINSITIVNDYNNEQISEAMALLNDSYQIDVQNMTEEDLNALLSSSLTQMLIDTGEDPEVISKMTADLETAINQVIEKYESGEYYNN